VVAIRAELLAAVEKSGPQVPEKRCDQFCGSGIS
jgi:hypothetical protein